MTIFQFFPYKTWFCSYLISLCITIYLIVCNCYNSSTSLMWLEKPKKFMRPAKPFEFETSWFKPLPFTGITTFKKKWQGIVWPEFTWSKLSFFSWSKVLIMNLNIFYHLIEFFDTFQLIINGIFALKSFDQLPKFASSFLAVDRKF